MITVSTELAGAQRYCGDTKGERVDLPTLFGFWLDACALLDADLQITESWRGATFRELPIDSREQSLSSIENFTFEIGLDYRAQGSSDRFVTLHAVAPERVADAEGRGEKAVAFYGVPRSVILSFDPAGYEFRLWYVPSTTARADMAAAAVAAEGSGLPEVFRPYREALAAHAALPHAGHDAETYKNLMGVVVGVIAMWEPRWRRFKDKPIKREGTRRPGYRASQGSRRIPRRGR